MKDRPDGDRAWVTTAGLAGAAELDLLHGFCERAASAGLPLARALVLIDTLHPIHEGRVFRWSRAPAPDERTVIEQGRTSEGGAAAERWRSSPFYHLLDTGGSALRRNLARGDPADFANIEELRSQGQLIHRFAADGVIGEMDCVYSSWTTDTPSGCADEQVQALTGPRAAEGLPVTRPHLGLHIGEVFYGDIGSPDRLDFTVVGPAVNEASRIAPMCRSAERGVLLSSAFAAAACEEDRAAFVSVGRYAFRGVGRAHAIHAGTGGRWPQSPRVSLSGEPLQLRSPDMPSWRADSGWIRSLAVDQSIATMAVTGSRPPTAPGVVAFKAPLTPAVDSGR